MIMLLIMNENQLRYFFHQDSIQFWTNFQQFQLEIKKSINLQTKQTKSDNLRQF